jgi:WD40 repeat protein
MIATLINCVAEATSSGACYVMSVAFSPDGTKIVSGSWYGTIEVRDSGALLSSNSPLLGQN